MVLTSLSLRNFRNHLRSDFSFSPGANIFLGDNGQGKTNIVEAISYLCLTRSFYEGGDAVALHVDHSMFEVEGVFHSEHGVESHARVAYDKSAGRKVFSINRRPVEPFSQVFGKFPVVVSSFEHFTITMGSPGDRRRFVDMVISQASPVYLERLIEYRKVIRQRNKVLLDAKLGQSDSASLEPWDEQLVRIGGFIMHRRALFTAEFQSYLKPAFSRLVGEQEVPTLEYPAAVESGAANSACEFEDLLQREIRQKRYSELRMGTSLVGPHRDEFLLKIGGLDLRKFASQGQHKTFILALKIAEFFYLQERCNETPLLLLDDVFSELDEHRSRRLLEYVATLSQTFITCTTRHLLEGMESLSDAGKTFTVKGGMVREMEQVPSA